MPVWLAIAVVMIAGVVVMIAGVVAAGCGGGGDGPRLRDLAPGPYDDPPRCTSMQRRDPNGSEGPEMMPGHACIACHAYSNAGSGEADAPIFAFAGTVFPSAHEPDDCVAAAAAGADVEVTDARGKSYVAAVNAVGNFMLEVEGFAYPVSGARVRFQGRERRMSVRPPIGDCNSCHTQDGKNSAPGRIKLP